MAGTISAHLNAIGIEIPTPGKAGGNYVPYVITGNLVYLSGQVPVQNGELKFVGKVGKDLSVEEAQQAARMCALNLLAQLKAACGGDLDRVARCVKLVGFVNATDDFGQQPKVINGASDVLVAVFGDAGRHARSAVGVASLPSNVPVEVEAVFELHT